MLGGNKTIDLFEVRDELSACLIKKKAALKKFAFVKRRSLSGSIWTQIALLNCRGAGNALAIYSKNRTEWHSFFI